MGRYITPETLGDGKVIVRTLFLPYDVDILGAVNGALLDLTYAASWESDGGQTPEDTAALFETIFWRYKEGAGGVIGSVFLWAGDTVPVNALECDGGTYGRATYPTLYDALGSTYHVDADNFRVPDLRSRVPVGAGQGSGLSNRALGAIGGLEGVSLSGSEMPSHSHTEITAVAAVINGGLEAPAAAAVPGFGNTGLAGLGQSHENMPPFHVLRFCIWAT